MVLILIVILLVLALGGLPNWAITTWAMRRRGYSG